MFRDKLTHALGHDTFREVIRAKVTPYRMVNFMCSLIDEEIEAVNKKMDALTKKQESQGSKIHVITTAGESA